MEKYMDHMSKHAENAETNSNSISVEGADASSVLNPANDSLKRRLGNRQVGDCSVNLLKMT